MINAIKNSTLTDLQVKTLNIREKELNYWSTTFQTMASQSAILAGFCYGGLSMEIEGKVPGLIQFGYLATTTGGMGFGLLCITIAALVSTLIAMLAQFKHSFVSVACWGLDSRSEVEKEQTQCIRPLRT